MEAYKKESKSFEGFETWTNAFRMKYKMHSRIFFALAVFVLLSFVLSINFTYTNRTDVAARWLVAKMFCSFKPGFKMAFEHEDGRRERTSARSIANTPWVEKKAKEELSYRAISLLKLSSFFLFYPFVIGWFKKRSSKQSGRKYIRGARIDEAPDYIAQAKKRKDDLDIPFGSIRQPILAEPKHTLIVGRPGTGKTVSFNSIVNRVIERGEKGLIYDNKGDYLSKFFNPETDLIFNPLDNRSLGWNVFNEIRTIMDVDAIAASLIPENHKENPFWINSARAVFSGILHNLLQKGKRSNCDIWEMIIEDAPNLVSDLKATKGGEAGHRFVEKAGSNQTLGVLAKLMEHTRCFEYMAENDGDFSINTWLNNGKPGMIFITNYADAKDTLKPVLTLFVDMVGRKLLSMPESHDRRFFIFLDEFNTLQRMTSILDMLTLSRSKGGCIYIGVQDYGKIDSIYSRDLRQSIVNACSNSIVFALSGDAAKIASENIGDTQFMESSRTWNMGVNDFRDGISLSERKQKEPLILPTELQNLKDMQGIVKFPNYNHVKSTWWHPDNHKRPETIFPDKNPPFVLRDDLLIDNILEDQQEEYKELDIIFEE